MYWTGATGLRFIRPIRWVVALLGGKPIRVQAGRMQSPEMRPPATGSWAKQRFRVSGAKDYVQKLKSNFVLVRPEDRKKKIEGELKTLASGKGLRIHEDQSPHGHGYLS